MEFTLSNCYPITLPQALPGALQLGKGGKIQSHIHPSGELLLSRVAGREVDDTLLGQFLGFLAGDMANHPERLQAVDARFVQRLQSLVGGIELISICSCRRMLNERGQDHTQDCNQNQ